MSVMKLKSKYNRRGPPNTPEGDICQDRAYDFIDGTDSGNS